MNVFYSPRNEERSRRQLIMWFAPHFDWNNEESKNIAIGLAKTCGNGVIEDMNNTSEILIKTDVLPHRPLLVVGSVSKICTLVSPRFSLRYIGDLMEVVADKGFTVEELYRTKLNDKSTTSLFKSSQ